MNVMVSFAIISLHKVSGVLLSKNLYIRPSSLKACRVVIICIQKNDLAFLGQCKSGEQKPPTAAYSQSHAACVSGVK